MKKISRLLLLSSCFFVLFYSCKKKLETSWDVDVLIPLIKTTLNISNLIEDSLIQTNTDNSLSIVYENTLFELSLDTLVQIPDTTITDTFFLLPLPFPPDLPICIDFPTCIAEQEIRFNFNGPELTIVKIRSGEIKIELTSTVQERTVLNYQMPGATKGEIPFEFNEEVPAGSQSSPATITKTFDMTGYTIDLTGSNGNDFNRISTIFIAKIHPDGDTTTPIAGDYLMMKNSFIDITIEYARGYFGQYNIIAEDSTDLDIFDNIISGSFDLESIDIALNIKNGFGIDIQATIKNLTSINTQTNNSVPLNHPIIGSAINLNRATDNPSPPLPFTYSDYDIIFNNSNSNTDELIENIPDRISYSFDLMINPDGNQSLGNDFLYYDSDLKIFANIELPFSLTANELVLIDTVEFTLSENNIIDGFLYLYADNGFPFDVTPQFYLLDENNIITDSLIIPGAAIEAAPLDNQLKVTGKKLSKLAIPLSKVKLDKLYETKKMLIWLKLTTTQPPPTQPNYIRIYSDYVIDLKLVGDFNYGIDVN